MRRWYVVQTRPRDESTALFHLTRQGFEGYLPRFLKSRRHARKVDVTPTPLFPGYLFVALDLAQPLALDSRTVGVSRLVCNAKPAPFRGPSRIFRGTKPGAGGPETGEALRWARR